MKSNFYVFCTSVACSSKSKRTCVIEEYPWGRMSSCIHLQSHLAGPGVSPIRVVLLEIVETQIFNHIYVYLGWPSRAALPRPPSQNKIKVILLPFLAVLNHHFGCYISTNHEVKWSIFTAPSVHWHPAIGSKASGTTRPRTLLGPWRMGPSTGQG